MGVCICLVPYIFGAYFFLEPLAMVLTLSSVVNDQRPLPPKAVTAEEDVKLFADDPWIDGPIKVDYGTNLRYMDAYSSDFPEIKCLP